MTITSLFESMPTMDGLLLESRLLQSTLLLFGFVTLAVYGVSIIRQKVFRRPIEKLPMPPGCHWFYGHLSALRGTTSGDGGDFQVTMKQAMSDYANENGQTGFWIGDRRCVSVLKWEDARTVLHAEYQRTQVSFIRRHLDMFLGKRSIGVMKGSEWKFHRAVIRKAFTANTIRSSKPAIEQVTTSLVESLKRKHLQTASSEVTLDVESLMKMIALDVFGKTSLSQDFNCCEQLQPSQVADAFEVLCTELTKRVRNPLSISNFFYSIPVERNRQHYKARTYLRSLLADLIKGERADRKSEKNSLLSLIIESYHSKKMEATGDQAKEADLDQTLSDTMMVFLFAGYDTTSITLTYALYLVSQFPDVESACLQEIESAPDDLVYCTGVILETLRLYPPGTVTPRTLQKPIALSGDVIVPEGSNVLIPIWLLQRDARNFPEPTQFRPDRWVRKEGDHWVDRLETDLSCSDIAPGNHKALMAFSDGARNCPGRKFAMQEATVALAGLLKDLEFRTVPGYKMTPMRSGVVQRPKGGLPMQIRQRKS
jgi:cytochrome P450